MKALGLSNLRKKPPLISQCLSAEPIGPGEELLTQIAGLCDQSINTRLAVLSQVFETLAKCCERKKSSSVLSGSKNSNISSPTTQIAATKSVSDSECVVTLKCLLCLSFVAVKCADPQVVATIESYNTHHDNLIFKISREFETKSGFGPAQRVRKKAADLFEILGNASLRGNGAFSAGLETDVAANYANDVISANHGHPSSILSDSSGGAAMRSGSFPSVDSSIDNSAGEMSDDPSELEMVTNAPHKSSSRFASLRKIHGSRTKIWGSSSSLLTRSKKKQESEQDEDFDDKSDSDDDYGIPTGSSASNAANSGSGPASEIQTRSSRAKSLSSITNSIQTKLHLGTKQDPESVPLHDPLPPEPVQTRTIPVQFSVPQSRVASPKSSSTSVFSPNNPFLSPMLESRGFKPQITGGSFASSDRGAVVSPASTNPFATPDLTSERFF